MSTRQVVVRWTVRRVTPVMHIKALTTLAVSGVAALGLSACGGDDTSSSSNPDSGAMPQAAAVKPLAEIPTLSGKSTQVALDAGFVEALGTLKLAPAPTGDASISKTGTASFPITGGTVKYFKPGSISPYVQGEIDHAGSGLSLTGGGKVVKLTNFVIDPGKSVLTGRVTVDGKVAAPSAPLFFLDGRTLQPLKMGANSTAILEGTTVKLKEEAAQLLNTTFGTDALQAGLVIGVAKITVNTA
jgi:hypothetical protein